MNKQALKLGDTVTARYGNVMVTGKIDSFGGGWIILKFSAPQDLGNRVENDGVGIRPSDRDTVRLVESGPALTWDDVGSDPQIGTWLRSGVR